MMQLGNAAVTTFAQSLLDHLDELLAPLVWLADELAAWRAALCPAEERLILWSWRHGEARALYSESDFALPLQPAARAYWQALSLFHRASSLAEAFHSWLRPRLQAHRGMPPWLLPLLQVCWNHHRFARGKRAGATPLELAGLEDPPSLAQLIDQLTAQQPDPAATEQVPIFAAQPLPRAA